MKKKRVHPNSIAAYHSTDFADRDRAVIDTVSRSTVPLTVREIAERLGFGINMNAVAPSVTRLVDQRVLCECGKVTCKSTGKAVRTVCLVVTVQQVLA